MYPSQPHTLAPYVDLVGVDTLSEGARRPGFFRGVSTVVTKLLNIVQPRAVYFGQKDGMQCMVVRRLIDALNFDVELVVGETVREADGLAMSSRNVYLDAEQRAAAPAVYRALRELEALHAAGERDAHALRQSAADVIAAQPLMAVEYVSLQSFADGLELEELPSGAATAVPTMASIAVRLGSTRLIDNIVLH